MLEASRRGPDTLADKQILATFVTRNRHCQYGADGLAFDSRGNLYVGNFGDGAIHKITFDQKGTARTNTIFAKTDHDYELDPAKPGFLAEAAKARMRTTALPLIKLGGTIGVYGVIADEAITIEKAKGPYNFNLCVHQWPTRRRERAAQGPLCDWIRAGKLKPEEFITHEFPVERINDALEAVKRGEVIKALLRY
jgi:threonine dehydrogenase-like Zn-dependent dehydrogenase